MGDASEASIPGDERSEELSECIAEDVGHALPKAMRSIDVQRWCAASSLSTMLRSSIASRPSIPGARFRGQKKGRVTRPSGMRGCAYISLSHRVRAIPGARRPSEARCAPFRNCEVRAAFQWLQQRRGGGFQRGGEIFPFPGSVVPRAKRATSSEMLPW